MRDQDHVVLPGQDEPFSGVREPDEVLLRTFDLFSGLGGFSLGLERTGGFKTVAFSEINEYANRVLAKHWPTVRRLGDVRAVGREQIAALGPIDAVCAGFPCQALGQPHALRVRLHRSPAARVGRADVGRLSSVLRSVSGPTPSGSYAAAF